ncbi:MAG: hypothetical protein ACR2GA_06520 [Chloroflexota bacterium]
MKTTRYPREVPILPLRTVPSVDETLLRPGHCAFLASVCPTGALADPLDGAKPSLVLDYGKCVFCGLCAEALPGVVTMAHDYELAARNRGDLRTTYVFRNDSRGH